MKTRSQVIKELKQYLSTYSKDDVESADDIEKIIGVWAPVFKNLAHAGQAAREGKQMGMKMILMKSPEINAYFLVDTRDVAKMRQYGFTIYKDLVGADKLGENKYATVKTW